MLRCPQWGPCGRPATGRPRRIAAPNGIGLSAGTRLGARLPVRAVALTQTGDCPLPARGGRPFTGTGALPLQDGRTTLKVSNHKSFGRAHISWLNSCALETARRRGAGPGQGRAHGRISLHPPCDGYTTRDDARVKTKILLAQERAARATTAVTPHMYHCLRPNSELASCTLSVMCTVGFSENRPGGHRLSAHARRSL